MSKQQGVFAGMLWRFGERFAAQGVSFVVSLVLARLLLPEYYGVISIVKVFLVVCKAVVQDGLGYALIQKQDADKRDFSTVFFAQGAIGLILYAALFFSAPILASWYSEPVLTPVFRVMVLSLPIGALNCVQQAYVTRTMQFRRFFFSTIIGTVLSAGIGLGMAYAGCGVWALVVQDLSNLCCDTVILWITVKWRPSAEFSWVRLKGMLQFSWKLLVSTMLDNLYNSAYPIVLGKLFGTVRQGYYDRGDIIPNVIASNTATAFKSVLLSAFSKKQEQAEELVQLLRRSIRMTAFILFPLMAGIIAAAKPLTLFLLGEKWADSAVYLQYCSLFFAFSPLAILQQQALTGLGRSDLSLRVELIKKLIGIVLLCAGIPFGAEGLLAGRAISAICALLVTGAAIGRVLPYRGLRQAADLLPSALLSLGMGVLTWMVGEYAASCGFHTIWILLAEGVLGAGIYAGAAFILRMPELKMLFRSFKKNKE